MKLYLRITAPWHCLTCQQKPQRSHGVAGPGWSGGRAGWEGGGGGLGAGPPPLSSVCTLQDAEPPGRTGGE